METHRDNETGDGFTAVPVPIKSHRIAKFSRCLKNSLNLLSFVALDSGTAGGGLCGSATRAGFLPPEHQGTFFSDAEAAPEKMIPNLRNQWMDKAAQPKQPDAMQVLNRNFSESFGHDDYLDGRIKSIKSAYRMQAGATDAFDIFKESEATRADGGRYYPDHSG